MKLVHVLFGAVACGIVGCAAEPLESEEYDVATATQAAMASNALVKNALVKNALVKNALVKNALVKNSLDPDVVAALQGDDEDSVSARQLLQYAVGCALPAGESVTVTVNGAPISYPGMLGLAPAWADGGLDLDGQKWVTACLLARTNAVGIQVLISTRGELDALQVADPGFTVREGAFWGNLWDESQYLYSCYDEANLDHARKLLRHCAAGFEGTESYPENQDACDPIDTIGSCQDVCTTTDPNMGYYLLCPGDREPLQPDHVITTFLLP